MLSPTVGVVAFPHLYTSVIASAVQRHGGYRVDAPDVLHGHWEPTEPYDVVIASLPVPREWGRVVIRLPEDFRDGLSVTVGDIDVVVDVDDENPLADLLALLDVVAGAPGAVAVVDLTGARPRRPRT